jgi:hypothetical protein
MATLRWIGEPISEGRVTERRFDLVRETGVVPGILWTPGAAGSSSASCADGARGEWS